MSEKAAIHLIWEGQSTLVTLRELVHARMNFELQLPPDYHFALFSHLYPQAAAGVPEQIDISGTADLIDKVAEIHGLQELAEVKAAIAATRAHVRIQSPGPGILVCFPSPESA